jgi:hypothetical protein
MMLPALARKLMPRTTVRPGAAAGQSVLRGRGWTSGSRGRRYGGRIDRVPAANLHVHTRWALDSGSVAGAGRATIAAANTQHCTATEYTDQRANKRAGLRWWALSRGYEGIKKATVIVVRFAGVGASGRRADDPNIAQDLQRSMLV